MREGTFRANQVSVPKDVQTRIREVVDRRDREGVKALLDHALEARQFSRGDLLGYQRAFAIWADKGVNAFLNEHLDGLESWLAEVDRWLHKYRKRCSPRVRGFIDFFSYQAKTRFYVCYANFWSSLIPWLEEHYGLQRLSKRFLRVWHNQNQPIEVPHGQTPGGIVYR